MHDALRPLWVTLVLRIGSILVLSALGVHAYVQYRRRGDRTPASQSWMFAGFALILFFGVVANFHSIYIAVVYHRTRGPLNYGLFSFLLFLLYLIFLGGVARRARHWV